MAPAAVQVCATATRWTRSGGISSVAQASSEGLVADLDDIDRDDDGNGDRSGTP